MQRRALRWMALGALLISPACIPSFHHVHDIEAAEGRVYLVVQGAGRATPFFVSSAMDSRVFASADSGKTWEELKDAASARDVVPVNGSCTLLVQGAELRRSTDGGRTSRLLPLKGMVSGAVEREGTLAVHTQTGLFLSRDCGAHWQSVPVEMLTPEDTPWHTIAAVAPRRGGLAVASGRGRVYSKADGEAEWTEAIVGPVRDLIYHQDRLYALTQMNTLAEIRGSEVRHAFTDLTGYQAKFLPCGGDLYFHSGHRLYREAGDGVIDEALRFDPGPEPAVAFERGSCRTLWAAVAREDGITLQRLDLETGTREDIPFSVD